MRVAATNVLPGDRVRGIGLVVEYSEPETDFSTALVGKVSSRPDPAAGYDADGPFQTTDVKVVLPNNHLVNVVRSDSNFHDDRVAAVSDALTRNAEDDGSTNDTTQTLVDELHRIANMPRGQYVDKGYVYKLVFDLSGTESAIEVLDQLDTLSAGATVTTIPFD
jgi:hypothetical protein